MFKSAKTQKNMKSNFVIYTGSEGKFGMVQWKSKVEYVMECVVPNIDHIFGTTRLHCGDNATDFSKRKLDHFETLKSKWEETRRGLDKGHREIISFLHALGLMISNAMDSLGASIFIQCRVNWEGKPKAMQDRLLGSTYELQSGFNDQVIDIFIQNIRSYKQLVELVVHNGSQS